MKMTNYLKKCASKPDENGCVIWQGTVNTCAGTPILNKRPVRRWLASIKLGRALADDETAMPTCGNKMCVSIHHVGVMKVTRR